MLQLYATTAIECSLYLFFLCHVLMGTSINQKVNWNWRHHVIELQPYVSHKCKGTCLKVTARKQRNGSQPKLLFSCSGRQTSFTVLINISGHAIST